MEQTHQTDDDVNSLEAPDTEAPGGGSPNQPASPAGTDPAPAGKGKNQRFSNRFQGLITHLNIYLLFFILILVVSGVGVFVSQQRNKKELAAPTLTTQELSQEDLKKINESEAKVGDPKQTLTIESNAVFSGRVLVRDSLDVAGTIKVGGALSLPGLTVGGTSSFDQIQANKLSINGDTNVLGILTVQKNVAISGGATFGGPVSVPQLTVQSLQLNSDLSITRHIDAGGPTPSRSDGTALGNGGTSSVGGSDTAGTVTINTGSNPAVGCFVTVNFSSKFNSTPHVVITPIGSAAASLNYYVNRASTGFSICTTNAAPASQNFAFDYIVID
jgi:cytoskeletal protein CcmA (bactofilin family)